MGKRRKKPAPGKKSKLPVNSYDIGWHVKEIIKCLDLVTRRTGVQRSQVFSDWLSVTEATLQALPAQIKTIGQTGQFGPDDPELSAIFSEVQRRYSKVYSGTPAKLWDEGFGHAFALLLEATRPGLWNLAELATGSLMGPDLLGEIYHQWGLSNPKLGQYMTPWHLAYLISGLLIRNGERDVHDRIKAALCHPDNAYGAATLVAGLVGIPAGRTDLGRDWFFTRLVPAAVTSGYFEPIVIQEPAVGSGALLLSAAIRYPPWAVKMGLVRFMGRDISEQMVKAARINAFLYGLNGYSLQLEAAATEAISNWRQREVGEIVSPKEVCQLLPSPAPGYSDAAKTFEGIFRQKAAVTHKYAPVPWGGPG